MTIWRKTTFGPEGLPLDEWNQPASAARSQPGFLSSLGHKSDLEAAIQAYRQLDLALERGTRLPGTLTHPQTQELRAFLIDLLGPDSEALWSSLKPDAVAEVTRSRDAVAYVRVQIPATIDGLTISDRLR